MVSADLLQVRADFRKPALAQVLRLTEQSLYPLTGFDLWNRWQTRQRCYALDGLIPECSKTCIRPKYPSQWIGNWLNIWLALVCFGGVNAIMLTTNALCGIEFIRS